MVVEHEEAKKPYISQPDTYIDYFKQSPGNVSTSYGNNSQQKLIKPFEEEHFDEDDLLKELMNDDSQFAKKFRN